jgi:hypothetical protein
MTSITRRLATALFLTVIAAAPALAQTATIDYDHSVNFLKFKTFSWEKLHATDPSVEDRITIAVKRDMEGRYMTEVAKGGDVTITAVEATQSKAEFVNFYNALDGFVWQSAAGAGGFLDAGTTVADVPLGTVIIDIYDTHTHRLLWRGAITEPVAAGQDKNDRTIDHAVTVLIGKYPPPYKKP